MAGSGLNSLTDSGSAQPCGCDPGCNHRCDRHAEETVRVMVANTPNDPPHNPTRPMTYSRLDGSPLEQPWKETEYVDAKVLRSPELGTVVTWKPARYGPKAPVLPTDPAERKTYPIFSGLLQYFPDACAAVAHVSYVGNEQHNPGQPLHWDRSKSMDQFDTALRHMMEGSDGQLDTDNVLHLAKAAWRTLAALQLAIEKRREGQS